MTRSARLPLAPETSSASMARRFVGDRLTAWEVGTLVDTAMLLVSELVTNAVLHTGSGPELVMHLHGGRLRVEVHDQSPLPPARKHHALDAATGRGIRLVEELSASWGCDADGAGKVVWFELDAPRGGDVRAAADAAVSGELLSPGFGMVEGPAGPAGRPPGGRLMFALT